MSGPTGAAGAAGRAQDAAGTGGGTPGRDAGSTSVMPPVGPDGSAQAPRRRQGGANGEQAQQRAAAEASGGAGDTTAAGGGYSTPTTYSKGQPTPPRGTPVPGGRPSGKAPRPGSGGSVGGGDAARRPAPAAPPSGRTRRARLRVVRTDPWTVMKVSFLLSVALGVVTVVGVSLLWMVLDAAGVFSSVGGTLQQATTGADASSGFNLQSYLSFGNVFMFTLLVAVIDVVLLTALCTLGSFIYNTAAGMTGGVELTLAEED